MKRRQLATLDVTYIQQIVLYLKQNTWQNSAKVLKTLTRRVRKKKESRIITSINDNQGNLHYETKHISKSFLDKQLYDTTDIKVDDINTYLGEYYSSIKLSKITDL
ncbi:UNVERIFIED_CONTAM: hypothetical protein K2H54_021427 [Gekko kuhli]